MALFPFSLDNHINVTIWIVGWFFFNFIAHQLDNLVTIWIVGWFFFFIFIAHQLDNLDGGVVLIPREIGML